MSGPGDHPGIDAPPPALLTGVVADENAIEAWNRGCFCISLSTDTLEQALAADLAGTGLPPLLDSHPNLFAAAPVFVSRRHVSRMAAIIRAVEQVVRTTEYRQATAGWTPRIARHDPGARGVFFGYDFHLGPGGPRLIEINTNAGGALLNPEISALLTTLSDPASFEDVVMAMFLGEWRLQEPGAELSRIAIVDESPRDQAMYPEFELFRRLFERGGIETLIVDPRELELSEGELRVGGRPINLVYNRLVDFYLESEAHAALAEAYRRGTAVITPHPHAYASFADKRNLTLLSSPESLAGWGVDEATRVVLAAGIPETVLVSQDNGDELWSRRRQLFFKPVTGHGSRGAYRGAKLTRRVWQSILAGGYVAQELVQPSEHGHARWPGGSPQNRYPCLRLHRRDSVSGRPPLPRTNHQHAHSRRGIRSGVH